MPACRARRSTSAASGPSKRASRRFAPTGRGTNPTTNRSRRRTGRSGQRASATSPPKRARTARSCSPTCSTSPTSGWPRGRPTADPALDRALQGGTADAARGLRPPQPLRRQPFPHGRDRRAHARPRLPLLLADRERRDRLLARARLRPGRQLRATRWLLELVARRPAIERVYVYTWFGGVTASWDSGLVTTLPDGTTVARPAYDLLAQRLGAPRGPRRRRRRRAWPRSRPWPAGAALLGRPQTSDHIFPNPALAEIPHGHTGFAPPNADLRAAAARRGAIRAERAWPTAVSPARASAVRHVRRGLRAARHSSSRRPRGNGSRPT